MTLSVATIPPDHAARLARAVLSLDGLSIGDAFGERFFVHPETVDALIEQRALPGGRVWHWTDDTAMAISVVRVLRDYGAIERDVLAHLFAEAYAADPARGYGGGAHRILGLIGQGIPWDIATRSVFGGEGSMGNGGAMRSAPIGGYFADDLLTAVRMAGLSADPTHAHPDGRAGAIAVAVAAALASSTELRGEAMLDVVLEHTPNGETREGLLRARSLAHIAHPRNAAALLGSGAAVLSSDTVPFALWCASRWIDDLEEALWATVSGLGDRDTTCAIVGGVVALRVGTEGLPTTFRTHREALPADVAERVSGTA